MVGIPMLSATTAITPMRPVLTLWLVLRTLFLPFVRMTTRSNLAAGVRAP